jgi:hypothetical protein
MRQDSSSDGMRSSDIAPHHAPLAAHGEHAHRALGVLVHLDAADHGGGVILRVRTRRRVVAVAHPLGHVQAARARGYGERGTRDSGSESEATPAVRAAGGHAGRRSAKEQARSGRARQCAAALGATSPPGPVDDRSAMRAAGAGAATARAAPAAGTAGRFSRNDSARRHARGGSPDDRRLERHLARVVRTQTAAAECAGGGGVAGDVSADGAGRTAH